VIDSMTIFFFTDDQPRSRAFYEKVLGVSFRQLGPHWNQTPAGQATFALHGQSQTGERRQDVTRPCIGFNVRDVAAVVACCREAGAEIVRDVYDESFGKVALVRDPEGRVVQFVQH
jgi:predicted enzyme related to lactoylglutathione lyase